MDSRGLIKAFLWFAGLTYPIRLLTYAVITTLACLAWRYFGG